MSFWENICVHFLQGPCLPLNVDWHQTSDALSVIKVSDNKEK